MPKVPYPYEVNGKLVTGNGSIIPICSLSNRSLSPSLTVIKESSNNKSFPRYKSIYLVKYLVQIPISILHAHKIKGASRKCDEIVFCST